MPKIERAVLACEEFEASTEAAINDWNGWLEPALDLVVLTTWSFE